MFSNPLPNHGTRSKWTEYVFGRLYSIRPSRWNFRYGNERSARSTCSFEVYEWTALRADPSASTFAVSSAVGAEGAGASASMAIDAAIRAARWSRVRTAGKTRLAGAWLLSRAPRRFGERTPGNVSGAMHAEYVIPESVPDVPAMPDAPPDMPGIPADPTPPGGDPEPMDI